jgi:hypothetical protein
MAPQHRKCGPATLESRDGGASVPTIDLRTNNCAPGALVTGVDREEPLSGRQDRIRLRFHPKDGFAEVTNESADTCPFGREPMVKTWIETVEVRQQLASQQR